MGVLWKSYVVAKAACVAVVASAAAVGITWALYWFPYARALAAAAIVAGVWTWARGWRWIRR